jgi:hypothetical protein
MHLRTILSGCGYAPETKIGAETFIEVGNIMSPKTLVAFLAGLVVASGITFFVMRKPQPAAQSVALSKPAAQVAPSAPAVAETSPAATPSDAMASNVPPAEDTTPAPSHPVKAHTARPHPKVIAQAQQPVVLAAPAPVQQPAPAPSHEQPVEQPQPAVESRNVVPPPPAPPPPEPNSVTIPVGTTFQVRMGETLTSERNKDGDGFVATLDQPLVVDGFVIAERGARVRGRVVQAVRSGRVEGLAKLAVELTEVNTSDGQRLKVDTSQFERQAATTHKADAAKIGGAAAIGAIIGAIAGGGKGAAIGAGAGGAAGTGGVMMTRGKPAEIPVETRVSFRLKNPVTITEQLH